MYAQQRPQHPFPEAVLNFGAASRANKPWAGSTPEAYQWQSAFYALFRGGGSALYEARVKRLSAYGWSPQDLLDACLNPGWAQWFDSPDAHEFTNDEAESWAALVQEVVLYHEVAASHATFKRLQLISNLSRAGWSHAQIGAHLGLTKQRIQKLLKEFSRDPGLRAT